MPLSWNEIKDRALTFAREWAGESREHAEDRSFWDGFFNVFGLTRRRVASFQEPVKKLGGAQGFIDLFWKGELIVEHKSRGKSLDKAYSQALDYFAGIQERDLPKRVLVSDFERIRLYELDTGEQHEFPLAELHKNVGLFAFIAGYSTQQLAPEDPVNRRAAERMGRLHDAIKAGGFSGHALEVLLVRLLFCLFAEDTGIFQPRKAFQDWVENRTAPDGADLGPLLARFFQVLDTPESQRGHALDEQLAAFPYVNGALFAERLPIADFDRATREALLDACALDWSQISPAIFGALFQSIMDARARRNLGAHYTSERNILKLIRPLFLDELRAEFEKVKGNRNRLFEFHKKLRGLTFLDPACGCGNFLVVAYRELRLLELDVLRAARTSGQLALDVHSLVQLDVDQFHGIEIEEFPAQIAQVALWLTDHQMNLKVSEEFGLYFARIPLKSSPHIVHGNALTLDWNDVLPAERCSYVMGNPPFVGAKFMDDTQRADAAAVFAGIDNAGLLDFVAAWYVQAARYLSDTYNPSPASGRGAGVRAGVISSQPRAPAAVPAKLLAHARDLRRTATDAETLLWHLLRNRALDNAKFRRQHPEAGYILDFYCAEARLVIELDGGQHVERETYDESRTAVLNARGIRVLRFWNDQVLKETESVLEQILFALRASAASATPSPLPLSRARERGSPLQVAFVSTNSICQGEQVGVLWSWLLAHGMHIHFAHRTFQWSNEARGVAAVHCVIVGFGAEDRADKRIFDYEDIRGEPRVLEARNINPYLVDAPDVLLPRRSRPICQVPAIGIGSQPIDNGNYLFTPEQKLAFLVEEPQAAPFFHRWIGSDEFINGVERWCLWLGNVPPTRLRTMPRALERVQAVKDFRLKSRRKQTLAAAQRPAHFGTELIPKGGYLVLPKVSSERRAFVPLGFMAADTFCSDLVFMLPEVTGYHFGILTSTMHMAWVRAVCGRLKSDFRYSAGIVYNNFPWPTALTPTPLPLAGEGLSRQGAAPPIPSPASGRGAGVRVPSASGKDPEAQADASPDVSIRGNGDDAALRQRVEAAAQGVLDARAQFPEASLADLYDPLTMPPALVKAHQALDRAVDAAYVPSGGKKSWASDAERVAFLFELYQRLTSLLPAAGPARKARAKRAGRAAKQTTDDR